MAKLKWLFIPFTFVALSLGVLAAVNPAVFRGEHDLEPPMFGMDLFQSNRYAQVDDFTVFGYDTLIDDDYALIASNQDLNLFIDETNQSFVVQQKNSGYLWYSDAQNVEDANLNQTMRAIMRAPAVIEYFPYTAQTDSLSTNTRRETSFDATVSYTKIDNGIKVDVNHTRIQIQYSYQVVLEDHDLVVTLNVGSIQEQNHKLATIALFPNFGATYKDDVPGYILIPDGPGALYRFKDNVNTMPVQYSGRYYGHDIGIRQTDASNPLTQLSLPVFAMVHGHQQHAFLGIIESGSYNALFAMSPSGANGVDYNTTGSVFILRETFVFPTNLRGDGITTVMGDPHREDIILRYRFLSDEDADVVGLAASYQDYLVAEDALLDYASSETKLRLELLMADSKRGLFGPKIVTMTSTKDAEKIALSLLEAGVSLDLVLRGWNQGGLSGTSPYRVRFERRLGSARAFSTLVSNLSAQGIDTYFYQDPVIAYDRSKLINPRTDLARGIYRRQITRTTHEIMYPSYQFAKPAKTASILSSQNSAYQDNSMHYLALDSIGYRLFSTYDSGFKSRLESVNHYIFGLNELDQTMAMYRPNAYAFPYTSAYYDMPLYSSQFTFYDDVVPFLPMVLQGRVDAYSPLVNYFANPVEQQLLLIDFHVYPSFIVTDNPTHLLKFTNARRFFSTEFSIWEKTILNTYHTIKDALDQVAGERIIGREVFAQGAVATTYANNITIIVNYTDDLATYQGIDIAPKSYRVVEVTP